MLLIKNANQKNQILSNVLNVNYKIFIINIHNKMFLPQGHQIHTHIDQKVGCDKNFID